MWYNCTCNSGTSCIINTLPFRAFLYTRTFSSLIKLLLFTYLNRQKNLPQSKAQFKHLVNNPHVIHKNLLYPSIRPTFPNIYLEQLAKFVLARLCNKYNPLVKRPIERLDAQPLIRRLDDNRFQIISFHLDFSIFAKAKNLRYQCCVCQVRIKIRVVVVFLKTIHR